MRRPVSSMPIARRCGTCRCSSVMPPSSGRRPTRGSGRPKRRLLGRDDDVAAQHHLEAAAQRVAVDAGDHRHVERLAQRDAAEAAGPRAPPSIRARSRCRCRPSCRRRCEKARSPAPVSTTQRTSRSLLDRRPDALQFALRTPRRSRSCTSGRSIVTRATWSFDVEADGHRQHLGLRSRRCAGA